MKTKTKLPMDLVAAARRGDLAFIKSHVNESTIDQVDKDGRTLLHHAAIEGHEPVIEHLILQKADVGIKDGLGWSALHFAAQQHRVNVVRLLIASGADVNAVDDRGNSVLWRAVFESKGKGDVIKLLLSHGADSHMSNAKGISPLQLAQTIANYDLAQFFFSK